MHPRVIACFVFLAHCLINVAADENSVHKLQNIWHCLFVYVQMGKLCLLYSEYEFKLESFCEEVQEKRQMGMWEMEKQSEPV